MMGRSRAIGRARIGAGLVLAAGLALTACRDEPFATVVLALDGVPHTVETLGISVRELETRELVASASIAAPRSSFVLGVPAEVPLEFFVVASTNRPGPAALRVMPAYVGRVLHTVPLGANQDVVGITVHRAGVLTLAVELADGELGDLEALRLVPGGAPGQAEELLLDEGVPRTLTSLVLRTGRWDATMVAPEDAEEDRVVTTGRALYVAPETESVATLVVERRPPVLSIEEPVSLRISRRDAPGVRDVLAPPGQDAPLLLQVEAIDGRGAVSPPSSTSVMVTLVGVPAGIVVGPTLFPLSSLPGVVEDARVFGLGRLIVRATARVPGDREIRGELMLNVVPEGETAGPPEVMSLRVPEPERLVRGGELVAEVLDARGLFASVPRGLLDLSGSDPWAFFPEGPLVEVRAGFGRIRREVLRTSGPHGLSVNLRAILTTTAAASPLEGELALPILTVPSP